MNASIRMGKVALVGAGPGAIDYLTLRAYELLRNADVVVYDRLVSAEILDLAPPTAQMLSVGKAPKFHAVPQDRINEMLWELAEAGQNVVRLKGGDPLIFGRGSEEAAYLRARHVPVEYVPGVTAAQGAAASTGVPLTHRDLATGVVYVTGHRAADKALDLDWKSLANPATTLVVYMGVATISEIALNLMREGLAPATPVMAISRASTPHEARLVSRLDRIGVDVKISPLEGPVLFVIGQVVSLYEDDALEPQEAPPEWAVMAGE